MLRLGVTLAVGLALAPQAATADLREWPAALGPPERQLTLSRDGGTATVADASTGAVTRPASDAGGKQHIDGSAGNDTLTVDFGSGNPAPAGLLFDGGAQHGGAGDALAIEGGRFDEAHVTLLPDSPDGGHNGVVDLDGTPIEFRGLEPLTLGGTATDVVITVPEDGVDNQPILEDDDTSDDGMLRLRSGNGTFETTTFAAPTGSLSIELTDDDETMTVTAELEGEISVEIEIEGGPGDDTLVMEDGASLFGGDFDGDADIDGIDYALWTSGIRANLGSTAPGLAAQLDGAQEVPAQQTSATGVATFTYDPATNTFTIAVTVDELDPDAVTGFHLHTAIPGVSGGITVPFDPNDLVPAGDGFTFTDTGVPLPPSAEAAFLGGVTYLNVHTGAAPGGLIRGQVFPTGLFTTLATGTATGTGGVTGVENATGGAGNDSLIGTGEPNTLVGSGGDDTLLGARGDDTAGGDDDSDILVWNNGDGSDTLDGSAGTDVALVNGAPAGDDVFGLAPGAGGRAAFTRTLPAPFSLDIGTTEQLTVAGHDGNDTFDVDPLAGVTGLGQVHFHGLLGDDGFFAGGIDPATGRFRGGPGNDALTGPSGTWNITGPGTGSGPGILSFERTENVTGGPDSDAFIFGPGGALEGLLDGGGGTDGVDYTPFLDPVQVNLGATVPGVGAALDGEEEVPPTTSGATGSATGTYDPTTRTVDVQGNVAGLDPASVIGFHAHAGLPGSNGPIVVDLGIGGLMPAGDGFTFQRDDIPVPANLEARLLSGQMYLNIHTSEFPNGAIRGQVFPGGLFVDGPGSATSTGGVDNIENATGGPAGDHLFGDLGANVLRGGDGDDTLVGSRGGDDAGGGAGDDIMVWSNGDGSDVMNGDGDGDTLLVNGDAAAGDAFQTQAGPGSRLQFNRFSPGPFALDVGTTEQLTVNGLGGNDVLDVFGTPALDGVLFSGARGGDRVGLPLGVSAPVLIRNGAGADDSIFVGDFLNQNPDLTVANDGDGQFMVTRTNPAGAPATVGGTEQVDLDAGPGVDTITIGNLVGVLNLLRYDADAGDGNDVFDVQPANGVSMRLGGNTGDDLLRIDPGCLPVTANNGTLQVGGFSPIERDSVELLEQVSAFWLGAPGLSVGEGAGTLQVPVMRSGTTATAVDLTTTDGSAIGGSDFTPAAGAMVPFDPAGTAASFGLGILNDGVAEPPEQLTVALTGTNGPAHLCPPTSAPVTIDDDDGQLPPAPTPTPAPTPEDEPFGFTGRVRTSAADGSATLRLDLPERGDVTIKATTRGGSAGSRAVAAKRKKRFTAARRRLRGVGPGTLRVKITPTKRAKRVLRRKGRLKVTIAARFKPSAGGETEKAKRNATLRLRRKRR